MMIKPSACKIGKYNIHFPFEPYNCQKMFMEKVVDCLDSSFKLKHKFCEHNALLESPTGTGKTLSTLCSTLSWLHQNRERLAKRGMFPLPKVVLSTRTHGQIQQVVKELKNSAYLPSVCTLGSRKVLCVNFDHPEDMQNLNSECGKLRSENKCRYFRPEFSFRDKSMKFDDLPKIGKVLDIEELCETGRKRCFCPYYYMRMIRLPEAELIVLPYNYLIQPSIKKTINLDLSNSILVFDEAHNLEKTCEQTASFTFDSSVFVQAISELSLIIEKTFPVGVQYNDHYIEMRDGVVKFKELLMEFEEKLRQEYEVRLKKKKIITVQESGEKIVILKGDVFGKYVEDELDMSHESKEITKSKLEILHQAYLKLRFRMPNIEKEGMDNAYGLFGLKQLFENFFSFTTLNLKKMKKYYRFIITELPDGKPAYFDLEKHKRYIHERKEHFSHEENPKPFKFFKFEMLCLSPSIAIKELLYSEVEEFDSMEDEEEGEDADLKYSQNEGAELPPKCLILTSGTLSPLNFYEKMYDIKFPTKLENPHEIKRSQLSALVCSIGPTRQQLNSEFKNRSNKKYVYELASVLVNVCRIVPNGVLVFFPSTGMLRTCLNLWRTKIKATDKRTSLQRLEHLKKIFFEPGSDTNDFSERSKTSMKEKSLKLREIIEEYEKASETEKGGLLLAVCRGKLSEGLDFRDNKCRMCIVIGLPYPPRTDLKVKLKIDFYNSLCGKDSGWYQRQASSAVNQAIGRVIRHSRDYGMILLVDVRFSKNFHLSKWILPHKKNCGSFGNVTTEASQFFQKWKKNLENAPEFRKPMRKNYSGNYGSHQFQKIELNLKQLEMEYLKTDEMLEREEIFQRGPNFAVNVPKRSSGLNLMQIDKSVRSYRNPEKNRSIGNIKNKDTDPLPPPHPLFVGNTTKKLKMKKNNGFRKLPIPPLPPVSRNQNQLLKQNGKRGFSTGGGKKIEVNKKSLKKAKSILSNTGEKNIKNVNLNELRNQQFPKPLKREKMIEEEYDDVLPSVPPTQRTKKKLNKDYPSNKEKQKAKRSQFLIRLRGTLTADEYERFKHLIAEFKTNSRPFEKVAGEIITLIGKYKKGFCRDFMIHLTLKKQEKFDELWKKKFLEHQKNKIVPQKRKRKCVEKNENNNNNNNSLIVSGDDEEMKRVRKKRKLENIPENGSKTNMENGRIAESNENGKATAHVTFNPNTLKDLSSPLVRKPPESKCMICKNLYEDPYSSECGHVACFKCWSECLSHGIITCPLCRSEIGDVRKVFF